MLEVRERERIMKAQNIMKSLVIAIILLWGFAQAGAVEYQGCYKPSAISRPHSAVSRQAVLPSAGFRSTSVYAAPEWAEVSMLNADGSVNESAYMGGGPRRAKMDLVTEGGGINTPEEEDEIENGMPLGDALIPLTLLAIAYCGWRFLRRRKEA